MSTQNELNWKAYWEGKNYPTHTPDCIETNDHSAEEICTCASSILERVSSHIFLDFQVGRIPFEVFNAACDSISNCLLDEEVVI